MATSCLLALYAKAAEEEEAAVPTLAVPVEVLDSAPGFVTTTVTLRTNVPPGPTESVAEISEMLPYRISAVPPTVTEAGCPT